MKGFLLAAHGSRATSTERTLEVLAERVRALTGEDRIEIGFMEFSSRTIPGGLDALRARGCTDITVIPYFLFDGIHIREDIPFLLEAYRNQWPDLRIDMGRTIGTDDRMAQLLAEQVTEVVQA